MGHVMVGVRRRGQQQKAGSAATRGGEARASRVRVRGTSLVRSHVSDATQIRFARAAQPHSRRLHVPDRAGVATWVRVGASDPFRPGCGGLTGCCRDADGTRAATATPGHSRDATSQPPGRGAVATDSQENGWQWYSLLDCAGEGSDSSSHTACGPHGKRDRDAGFTRCVWYFHLVIAAPSRRGRGCGPCGSRQISGRERHTVHRLSVVVLPSVNDATHAPGSVARGFFLRRPSRSGRREFSMDARRRRSSAS